MKNINTISIYDDLCAFLFLTIDAEFIKRVLWAGTSVLVKSLIVNVNKCQKPFF